MYSRVLNIGFPLDSVPRKTVKPLAPEFLFKFYHTLYLKCE